MHDQSSSYSQDQRPIRWTTKPQIYICSEGATLFKFIYEGSPTTMKPTFVALPYLNSYSTFHECSRITPCQPQASHHRHLTKPVVLIPYSTCLERKIRLLSTFITHWNTTTESTQKKSIYLSSKSPTTFQVGTHSSSFLTKST